MASCFGPNLAGNPFPLSSLYLLLSALRLVLGNWNWRKHNLRGNSLVSGQVVYPLGFFLGDGCLVGDGGVWTAWCDIAPLPNKCG